MRMIKKTLVLLLSAALCVILLAGCGPKEEETQTSDGLYFTKQEVRESPEWVHNLDAAQDGVNRKTLCIGHFRGDVDVFIVDVVGSSSCIGSICCHIGGS